MTIFLSLNPGLYNAKEVRQRERAREREKVFGAECENQAIVSRLLNLMSEVQALIIS